MQCSHSQLDWSSDHVYAIQTFAFSYRSNEKYWHPFGNSDWYSKVCRAQHWRGTSPTCGWDTFQGLNADCGRREEALEEVQWLINKATLPSDKAIILSRQCSLYVDTTILTCCLDSNMWMYLQPRSKGCFTPQERAFFVLRRDKANGKALRGQVKYSRSTM